MLQQGARTEVCQFGGQCVIRGGQYPPWRTHGACASVRPLLPIPREHNCYPHTGLAVLAPRAVRRATSEPVSPYPHAHTTTPFNPAQHKAVKL